MPGGAAATPANPSGRVRAVLDARAQSSALASKRARCCKPARGGLGKTVERRIPPPARPAVSKCAGCRRATARAGRQGRAPGGRRRRGGRPARPQRRRQDDQLLHGRRAWCAPMPARSASTAPRVERLPIHQRSRLGLSYLPQEASIFRKLTVEENIRAVLELQLGADGRAAARAPTIDEQLDGCCTTCAIEKLRDIAGAGAVGRRAAARRDRACAGHAAALHPARRAVRRRRPDRGDRDPAHHRLPEERAASAC